MTDLITASEKLKLFANLLELALYAPEGEVTHDGRAALQATARQIVLLIEDRGNVSCCMNSLDLQCDTA